MTQPSVHDLARAETGFRLEKGRLLHLDTQLNAVLQESLALPAKSGFPSDLAAQWEQQWKHVVGILHKMHALLTNMDEYVQRGDTHSLSSAMDSWRAIQSDDIELTKELNAIRGEASRLHGDARQGWESLDAAVTAHLEAIHACALALRVKQELLKDYTGAEASHVLAAMLSKLPNRAQMDAAGAEAYVQEYREAMHAIDDERHEFGGFMDFIKGLAMWVETPEERLKKKTDHPPR